MRLAKPHILLLFLNKFNKFNNTGAQMLDSIIIYRDIIITLKSHLKKYRFCHYVCNVVMNIITLNCAFTYLINVTN